MKRRDTGTRDTRILRGTTQSEIRSFFPVTRAAAAAAAAASVSEDTATVTTTVAYESGPRDLRRREELRELSEGSDIPLASLFMEAIGEIGSGKHMV